MSEYQSILNNYMERRWSPSELSGGKFCEIVYTILEGFGAGNYPSKPTKPNNFLDACRGLEKRNNVPRSFQILIPRVLPALYEVRNNRGVGHVGGDVDPNHMDATLVLAMCNWVMAELVRVFHGLDVQDAQRVVDSLVERRSPIIWDDGDVKRVLNTNLSVREQTLILVASVNGRVSTADIFRWLDYENKAYFNKTLKALHKERLVNLSDDQRFVEILPPGTIAVSEIVKPG